MREIARSKGVRIVGVSDASEAGAIAADAAADVLAATVARKGVAVLALPGGRSVQPFLEALADRDIPWDRVHVFMVDERWVPLDHPDSNFLLLKEKVLDRLVEDGRLPPANIHPFRAEAGLDAYAAELSPFGGYDVVVLGVGEDGHVAALYPHTSIRNDAPSFIEMTDSPKPPPHRMSASRGLLAAAEFGVVLFLGEGKRDAYAAFRDDAVTLEACPAKIAMRLPAALVLTDLE